MVDEVFAKKRHDIAWRDDSFSMQYIECLHVAPHTRIISFAFALVQLVRQIDAGKPFAKRVLVGEA